MILNIFKVSIHAGSQILKINSESITFISLLTVIMTRVEDTQNENFEILNVTKINCMHAPPTELMETAIVLVKPVGRWWKWKCWVNNLSLSVVYTGHVISHMCSCALHRNHGFPSIKIIFLYTLTHFSNTELQLHASREVDD